jgi:hypothetical protein
MPFVKYNDDKTAVKHYLARKELLKKILNIRLYETSG